MKGNAVAIAVIFAAWVAGAAIPVATPVRDARVVVTFHVHAARCDLRGSTRPAALKLVCAQRDDVDSVLRDPDFFDESEERRGERPFSGKKRSAPAT